MRVLDKILEMYPDTPALIADGLNDAIIGYEPNNEVMVYSIEKCIELLMGILNSDYKDASEYFYYNTMGAYMGEHTPIYVYTITGE